MQMSSTPQVHVIADRRHHVQSVLPPRPARAATPSRGTYAGMVLSLLSGTVALATYDLLLLVSLTVG